MLPQPAQPLRIAIVEDDEVALRMYANAVMAELKLELVATFGDVKSTKDWLRKKPPLDLLLTDLGLPDGSGLQVISACKRHLPDCNIMVITGLKDEDMILDAIALGALSYVVKNDALLKNNDGTLNIVHALLELHVGHSPISASMARKLLERIKELERSKEKVDTNLTRREIEILQSYQHHFTCKQVAKHFGISDGTVKGYNKSIYEKFSVCTRADALAEAKKRGIL